MHGCSARAGFGGDAPPLSFVALILAAAAFQRHGPAFIMAARDDGEGHPPWPISREKETGGTMMSRNVALFAGLWL